VHACLILLSQCYSCSAAMRKSCHLARRELEIVSSMSRMSCSVCRGAALAVGAATTSRRCNYQQQTKMSTPAAYASVIQYMYAATARLVLCSIAALSMYRMLLLRMQCCTEPCTLTRTKCWIGEQGLTSLELTSYC
jgi:hypothetical protein